MENRRRYDRIAATFPGYYQLADLSGSGHQLATVVNFTPDGLCFTARETIPSGAQGKMCLAYESGGESLLTFEVVWTQRFEVGGGCRAGARIIKEEALNEHAGVVARPPFIYTGFLVLGWAIQQFWPLPLDMEQANEPLGWGMIILGVIGMLSGVRQLRRAKTPVNPFESTRLIVTAGLFRYSRNPLYAMMTLIYFGVAVLTHNMWSVVLFLPLLLIMHFGVICREEAYLERKFGEDYLDYKQNVRRWI